MGTMLPTEYLPQGVLLEQNSVVKVPLVPDEEIHSVVKGDSQKPECHEGEGAEDYEM